MHEACKRLWGPLAWGFAGKVETEDKWQYWQQGRYLQQGLLASLYVNFRAFALIVTG